MSRVSFLSAGAAVSIPSRSQFPRHRSRLPVAVAQMLHGKRRRCDAAAGIAVIDGATLRAGENDAMLAALARKPSRIRA
jgi:hypothetical protein